MLEITTATNSTISEIKLVGTLDSTDIESLSAKLYPIILTSKYLLILAQDLKNLCLEGINIFLKAKDKLQNKSGMLLWVECSPEIQEIMDEGNFTNMFHFYSTHTEALQAIEQLEKPNSETVVYHISNRLRQIQKLCTLQKRTYTIGRYQNNDIQLLSNTVSRENHASIFFQPEQSQFFMVPNRRNDGRTPHVSRNFVAMTSQQSIQHYDYFEIGQEDILLFKDTSTTIAAKIVLASDFKIVDRMFGYKIKEFYQQYQELFRDVELDKKSDPVSLQILLRIYSHISSKLFQPEIPDLTSICDLLFCYLLQLLGNVDSMAVGTFLQDKLSILQCRNKTANDILIPESPVLEAITRSCGMKFNYQNQDCLVIPLEKVGFIYLAKNISDGEFSTENLITLVANAGTIAAAIHNGIIAKERERTIILEQEIKAGEERQQCLQPKIASRIPNLNVCCYQEQSMGIGGDYYDVIQSPQDQSWFFVIGDAQGHGMRAALIVATVRAYLRLLLQNTNDIAQVLSVVDELLKEDFGRSNHMSGLILYWDWPSRQLIWTGTMEYSPLWYHASQNAFSRLPNKNGYPWGMGPSGNQEFTTTSIRLEVGDMLLFYTDGIIEASNANNQQFGMEQLQQIFQCLTVQTTNEQLVRQILQDVENFSGNNHAQRDDITIVAIQCTADQNGHIPQIIPAKANLKTT